MNDAEAEASYKNGLHIGRVAGYQQAHDEGLKAIAQIATNLAIKLGVLEPGEEIPLDKACEQVISLIDDTVPSRLEEEHQRGLDEGDLQGYARGWEQGIEEGSGG